MHSGLPSADPGAGGPIAIELLPGFHQIPPCEETGATFDENAIPATNGNALAGARVATVYDPKNPLSNWIEVTLGSNLRLCDFATAGCRGTRYRSWLPGQN